MSFPSSPKALIHRKTIALPNNAKVEMSSLVQTTAMDISEQLRTASRHSKIPKKIPNSRCMILRSRPDHVLSLLPESVDSQEDNSASQQRESGNVIVSTNDSYGHLRTAQNSFKTFQDPKKNS
mmetsp:Transcript_39397/g.156474  ORF Transcript_39397/g.156474 Transcript_39397/m.156474 type:complete len:123 (-) Transcript_39397:32-400(-)